MEELLRATAALIFVISLILGLGWGLRRLSNGTGANALISSDLKIVEWRGVDARRKLAVIQWDGQQHLVCLGHAGDTLIASRVAPEPPQSPPLGDNSGKARGEAKTDALMPDTTANSGFKLPRILTPPKKLTNRIKALISRNPQDPRS